MHNVCVACGADLSRRGHVLFSEDAQRLASYEWVDVPEISAVVEAARCIPSRCVPARPRWHFARPQTLVSHNASAVFSSPARKLLLHRGYCYLTRVSRLEGVDDSHPLLRRPFFFHPPSLNLSVLLWENTLGLLVWIDSVKFRCLLIFLSLANFAPVEPVCPLAVKCRFAVFKQTSQAGGIGKTSACVVSS